MCQYAAFFFSEFLKTDLDGKKNHFDFKFISSVSSIFEIGGSICDEGSGIWVYEKQDLQKTEIL